MHEKPNNPIFRTRNHKHSKPRRIRWMHEKPLNLTRRANDRSLTRRTTNSITTRRVHKKPSNRTGARNSIRQYQKTKKTTRIKRMHEKPKKTPSQSVETEARALQEHSSNVNPSRELRQNARRAPQQGSAPTAPTRSEQIPETNRCKWPGAAPPRITKPITTRRVHKIGSNQTRVQIHIA